MKYKEFNLHKEMRTRYNLIMLMLIISTTITAQQLYLETGKTVSSFDYKNSQGNKLNNLQTTTHNFMALGYRNQILTKNLFASLGANYADYGAIGSDDVVGNFMEWNLTYLEFNFGLDYELFTLHKIKFYTKGTAALGLLLRGTQTLNNRVINLKNNDEFDKTLTNLKVGAGLSHPISDKLSVYVQYMYGKSLDQKNDTEQSIGEESLKIESHNISFGLLINLFKPKTSHSISQ